MAFSQPETANASEKEESQSKAIFQNELRTYFTTLTGYAFGVHFSCLWVCTALF